MMKWMIRVALILSAVVNVYFIYDEIRFHKTQELLKASDRWVGRKLSDTSWAQGLKILTNRLKEKNKVLLDKKYYYINVWTNWCKPCIKEMPWLDSIAGNLNKDVAYLFVSDLNDNVARNIIKRKNYRLKNFVFLNDMSDFISAICFKKGIKRVTYPMILILNKNGELLHYSVGAYVNAREASNFAEVICNL